MAGWEEVSALEQAETLSGTRLTSLLLMGRWVKEEEKRRRSRRKVRKRTDGYLVS